jgi:hypothetical protein
MLNNFADDIEDATGGDIEAIVVHRTLGVTHKIPSILFERPLQWDTIRQWLNYEYSDNFGRQECHNVTIWARGRVYWVHEYDGATTFRSVARNPPTRAGR